MSIIVAGGSSFVGQAVVDECIKNSRVSQVLVLTRRLVDPDLSSSPKLRAFCHHDIDTYSVQIMSSLKDAQGCIWCFTETASDFDSNAKMATEADADPFLTAVSLLDRVMASNMQDSEKLCFVFCSEKVAAYDGQLVIELAEDTRVTMSELKQSMLELAHSKFDLLIVRPQGISSNSNGPSRSAVIRVTDLAKALVNSCLDSSPVKLLENDTTRQVVEDLELSLLFM